METAEIIRSNKWRNSMKVKYLFTDDSSPETIATLCTTIIGHLNRIKAKESKSNLTEDSKHHVDNELDELIGHFEFLSDLATGKITEKEWGNYNFDGDFEQWFNDYMSQVYDLGDTKVLTTGNIQEKFMWID